MVESCIHDGFVGFRDLDDCVEPLYLYHWLLSAKHKHSTQAPGAIWVNLTTNQVREFTLPLPPRHLQRQFAERLSLLMHVRRQQQDHLGRLGDFFSSLQHDIFFRLPSTSHVPLVKASGVAI